MMNTKSFKEINARAINPQIPLCPEALPPSAEYFECVMRYNTWVGLHAVGTTKMGPTSDTSAVLDPELR